MTSRCWVVTRPEPDATALCRVLEARGHRAISAPIMAVRFATEPEPLPDGVQALAFTSANGVRAFERLFDRRDIPVVAVGDATARAAEAAGFSDVAAAGGTVDKLADLAAERLAPGAGPVVHLRGKAAAGDLAGALQRRGFDVRPQVLYAAMPVETMPEVTVRALRARQCDGVLFFSPRTATLFDSLAAASGLHDTLSTQIAACLSDAVADRLQADRWGLVKVATTPTMQSLVQMLEAP